MRFSLDIGPDDIGNLPKHMQEQVKHDLPRKVTREAQRLQHQRNRLDLQERELVRWNDVITETVSAEQDYLAATYPEKYAPKRYR